MLETNSKPAVVKTKNGKFAFTLDYLDRDETTSWLINYLESESINLLTIRIEKNPSRHMAYAVHMNFYHRYATKLNSPSNTERFCVSRAEAICLLVLFEGVVSIHLREIRSQLHKLLS